MEDLKSSKSRRKKHMFQKIPQTAHLCLLNLLSKLHNLLVYASLTKKMELKRFTKN